MYVLGVDLGTSSLKTLVMNHKGAIVTSAISSYDLIYPKSGYVEQNPKDWKRALKKCLDSLSKNINLKDILSIAISGQMHTLVLLDEKNDVLRNAILWNDVRTSKQCDQINHDFGKEIFDITNNYATEGLSLPKILWIQENEEHIWEKVNKILLPKDYLRFLLTGKCNMELTDASGTLMLDTTSKDWSRIICEKYDISLDKLPPIIGSTDIAGTVSKEASVYFGLSEKCIVVGGGADNACGAIGAGVLQKSQGLCSIGTSGVILSPVGPKNKPRTKTHFFYSADNINQYSMAVSLSSGDSLRWWRDVLNKDLSYEDLLSVKDIPVGSSELIFTPYLSGERMPISSSDIRGSFTGLSHQHSQKHLSRSVIEGISFSLFDLLNMVNIEKDKPLERLVVIGGGAKNEIWMQILADITNCTLSTLVVDEGPAYGAALLADVGLGWSENLQEAINKNVKYDRTYKPNSIRHNDYLKIHEVYQLISKANEEVYRKLSNLRGDQNDSSK